MQKKYVSSGKSFKIRDSRLCGLEAVVVGEHGVFAKKSVSSGESFNIHDSRLCGLEADLRI